MITGLFTLQHRARERERGRDWQRERERERRWFPDVRWNSESYRATPFLFCAERDLDQHVYVVMERTGERETTKRGEGRGRGEREGTGVSRGGNK